MAESDSLSGSARVLGARPNEANTLSVVCVDGATVQVNNPGAYLTVVDWNYTSTQALSSDPGGGLLGGVTGIETALNLVRFDAGRRRAPGMLHRARELKLGDYVVRAPWLSRVAEVSLDVDVAFDGGGVVCRARRKLSTVRCRDGLNRRTNSVFYAARRRPLIRLQGD